MANDYNFKPSLDIGSIAGLMQRKQLAEQELALRKRNQRMQELELIINTGALFAKGAVAASKMRQQREFASSMAELYKTPGAVTEVPDATTGAESRVPVPGPMQDYAPKTPPMSGVPTIGTMEMDQTGEQPAIPSHTEQGPATDNDMSNLVRDAANANPDAMSGQFAQSLFPDPEKQAKLDRNYIKQYIDIGGKVYGLTGRMGPNGTPEVIPIDLPEGERNPVVQPPLSPEASNQLTDFDTLGELAQSILDTPDRAKYIGPGAATYHKARLFTPKADPNAAVFYQKIQDLRQQIIYLRSGKQINEQEYKRLRDSLPSEFKNEKVFDDQMKTFMSIFNKSKERRMKELRKNYRNVPQSEQTGGLYTPPNRPPINSFWE